MTTRVETRCKVKVYELDGHETLALDNTTIAIESHWVYDDRVVLVADGRRYTVVASDLSSAVSKASR